MMTIDDDMLMAFVDGELDEISRARDSGWRSTTPRR